LDFGRKAVNRAGFESRLSKNGDVTTVEEQCQPELAGAALTDQFRTRDENWVLVKEGFTTIREHEIESLFAIGNGYLGNRGSLAESTVLSAPGTFIAGVFKQSYAPGSVPELMTLPDWSRVSIWIDNCPLSIEQGEVLEHRRVLDLRRGMLWREWRHRDPNGRITRIVAFRLASMSDRHLLLQSVSLTPENYSSLVRFETSMEVADGLCRLVAPESKARATEATANVLPLALRVPGRGITVAFGVTSKLMGSADVIGKWSLAITEGGVAADCKINVEMQKQYRLDRLISVYSSRETPEPFESAMQHSQETIPKGIAACAAEHAREWEARWHITDVEVDGDDSLQRALRFAGYHLISAANPDDSRVSIGARTLSGTAYKGHVFWDTEIYMLPFYIFTHPQSARALLEYRYYTLGAALKKAHAFGFRGAMYPWESADTGEETTPRAVFTPDGDVTTVLNAQMEVHITADVAFGIWRYWDATRDEDFFLRFGAEIMLECARFWASRGEMGSDGKYHIRRVIGPDEYHEDVDDDVYTNLMAAWNLRRGAETASLLRQLWPTRWGELAARLEFADQELTTWSMLADATFTGFDPRTLLFEQFSGYFNKEPVELKSYEPRTAAMDVILGHKQIQQTNIVKQADVILANYLLWDETPSEVCIANFRYYEPRTGHGSSLSPSIHALVAARTGDAHLAEQYLKQASEIDLGNNMGNAAGGVHAAALGGLWQAVVFGFAGARTIPTGLSFAPKLLPHWRRLSFPLQWRGRVLHISIEAGEIHVAVEGTEPLKLHLEGGSEIDAIPEHEYIATRTKLGWSGWQLVD
jgi:trehalose/maltose hydrolase-like predicted phosphorylase